MNLGRSFLLLIKHFDSECQVCLIIIVYPIHQYEPWSRDMQHDFLWLHLGQAEIARQEARLKMEKENLEKEKSVLMGTASSQDNQDGALEITVSGEKYRCLRFSKAKKWEEMNWRWGALACVLDWT